MLKAQEQAVSACHEVSQWGRPTVWLKSELLLRLQKIKLPSLEERSGKLRRAQGCGQNMQRENQKGKSIWNLIQQQLLETYKNIIRNILRARELIRISTLHWMRQRTLSLRMRKKPRFFTSVYNSQASYPQATQPPEMGDQDGERVSSPQFGRKPLVTCRNLCT